VPKSTVTPPPGESLVAVHDWTFLFGPGFCVGINGLLLGYLFYRSGLVPRPIALFGLVGGPLIFASAIAVLFGAYEQDGAHFLFSIPEIVFEFSEIVSSAATIAELAAQARASGRRLPLPVQARLPGGRSLFGNLSDCYDRGLVEHQFGRVRGRHLLTIWIQHLVYCWLAPNGATAHSSLIGRPTSSDSINLPSSSRLT